eukprot:5860779-Pleurochrysis_carterae.AAC.2
MAKPQTSGCTGGCSDDAGYEHAPNSPHEPSQTLPKDLSEGSSVVRCFSVNMSDLGQHWALIGWLRLRFAGDAKPSYSKWVRAIIAMSPCCVALLLLTYTFSYSSPGVRNVVPPFPFVFVVLAGRLVKDGIGIVGIGHVRTCQSQWIARRWIEYAPWRCYQLTTSVLASLARTRAPDIGMHAGRRPAEGATRQRACVLRSVGERRRLKPE